MSKRRTFDTTGYPCEPTDIKNDGWFYVRKEGLVVAKGVWQSVVPWRKILRAVDDHKKAKRRPAPTDAGGR